MSRRTDLEAAKKAARKEERKKELARERTVKQLKWAGVIVASAAVVIALIIGINALVHNAKTSGGVYMRDTVIAKNDYGEVDAAMLAYYIGEKYNDILNTSDDAALVIMGIDKTKKLNEMKYEADETWFDVLAGDSCEDAAEWLAYCLAADKADCELTEAELGAVQKRAERVDLSLYPAGLTVDDVVRAMKLQALGEKYMAIVALENTADAEAIDAEISKNMSKYFTVSYRYYYLGYDTSDVSSPLGDLSLEEVSVGEESDSSAEESAEESSEEVVVLEHEEAVSEAEKIASASSESEFVQKIYEFIASHFTTVSDEEAKEKAGEYILEDTKVSDAVLGKWMYDSNRKQYDTHVFDSETGTCAAVMITSLPKFQPGDPTVNISVISVRDEATAKLAAEYAAGGENAFEEACIIYSCDLNTCFAGGKLYNYQDVIKSDELNEWLHGESVKAGDIMTVESNGRWYVVRYDGEGLDSASSRAQKAVSSSKINDAHKSVISSGRVNKDVDAADVIDY